MSWIPDSIRLFLESATGHKGEFSDEMAAFWREMAVLYRNCNFQQIPPQVLPILFLVAKDRGIPIQKPPAVETKSAPTKNLVGAGAK